MYGFTWYYHDYFHFTYALSTSSLVKNINHPLYEKWGRSSWKVDSLRVFWAQVHHDIFKIERASEFCQKKVRNSTLCAALIENRPYLIQNWSKKSGNFRKPSSNIVEKLCRLKFSGIRSSLDGFLRWNWKALFTVSTGERFHAHHFTKTFITSTIFESPQISKNQNFRKTWGYHYEFFQIF